MLDQNLVTVQWGLLGVFGVVVTLLIRHANQHYRAYLREGTEANYQRALSWSNSIRKPAWAVLGGLIGLGLVGIYDAGILVFVPFESAITAGTRVLWFVFDADRSHISAWVLLAVPPMAQAALIGVVLSRLVPPVRPIIEIPLDPEDDLRWSLPGERPPSVIHFENHTPAPVQVHWIDFGGAFRQYPSIPARDGHRGPGCRSQETFEGHRWRLTRPDGWARTATAKSTPVRVVIDDVGGGPPPAGIAPSPG